MPFTHLVYCYRMFNVECLHVRCPCRPLTIILYVLFLFVTVVILLNVLIAQMSDTYTKVLSTAEGVYLYYRCRYIAKLENRRHRFKKRNCFRCLDKLKCSLEEGVCCCMRLKCCSRSKVIFCIHIHAYSQTSL